MIRLLVVCHGWKAEESVPAMTIEMAVQHTDIVSGIVDQTSYRQCYPDPSAALANARTVVKHRNVQEVYKHCQ